MIGDSFLSFATIEEDFNGAFDDINEFNNSSEFEIYDLNYNQYYSEGHRDHKEIEEYNSNNTEFLDNKSLIKELLKLDVVKNKL